MTCDCPPDTNGNPTCLQLAVQTTTPYPVNIPVTQKLQDRMREQGWAPIAETLNVERDRVMLAVVAASWVTATEGGDEHVIDIGSIEHILKEQPCRT